MLLYPCPSLYEIWAVIIETHKLVFAAPRTLLRIGPAHQRIFTMRANRLHDSDCLAVMKQRLVFDNGGPPPLQRKSPV